jgi:hypothetical protein
MRPEFTPEQKAAYSRGYKVVRRTCVMCGKRKKVYRCHMQTCGNRCRQRFYRWQRGLGPGPEHFGGLAVERN